MCEHPQDFQPGTKIQDGGKIKCQKEIKQEKNP